MVNAQLTMTNKKEFSFFVFDWALRIDYWLLTIDF